MQISKRDINEMAEMYGLPKELYTMKRGVKYKGEMRHDITIIPALIINGQYNKTKGHIHTTGHEEEYIVLEGEAIFLFENKKRGFWKIRAKKGQHIMIPGDCYHVTINPSKTKTLKLANWLSEKCISDYTHIEKKKGMREYYTTKGWVKNPRYK